MAYTRCPATEYGAYISLLPHAKGTVDKCFRCAEARRIIRGQSTLDCLDQVYLELTEAPQICSSLKNGMKQDEILSLPLASITLSKNHQLHVTNAVKQMQLTAVSLGHGRASPGILGRHDHRPFLCRPFHYCNMSAALLVGQQAPKIQGWL